MGQRHGGPKLFYSYGGAVSSSPRTFDTYHAYVLLRYDAHDENFVLISTAAAAAVAAVVVLLYWYYRGDT